MFVIDASMAFRSDSDRIKNHIDSLLPGRSVQENNIEDQFQGVTFEH